MSITFVTYLQFKFVRYVSVSYHIYLLCIIPYCFYHAILDIDSKAWLTLSRIFVTFGIQFLMLLCINIFCRAPKGWPIRISDACHIQTTALSIGSLSSFALCVNVWRAYPWYCHIPHVKPLATINSKRDLQQILCVTFERFMFF